MCYVLDLAIKDAAEVVDSFHADIFAVFEAGQCAGRKVVIDSQRIPILRRMVQCFPEWFIADHQHIPPLVEFVRVRISYVLSLEYLR